MLGWLLYEHGIEPHVTVFDKSARTDGTFSREDFTYDHAGDFDCCLELQCALLSRPQIERQSVAPYWGGSGYLVCTAVFNVFALKPVVPKSFPWP